MDDLVRVLALRANRSEVSELLDLKLKAPRRVLLLDGDIRRPVQHTVFQSKLGPGFAELLKGEVAVEEAVMIHQKEAAVADVVGTDFLEELISSPEGATVQGRFEHRRHRVEIDTESVGNAAIEHHPQLRRPVLER